MTTASPGVVGARQTGTFPLYNTTTDDLGKTVFTSPGRLSNTIIFDTVDTSTGANVAYNNATGVFTLSSGVTYNLTTNARLLNYTPPPSEPAALEWFNTATQARIGDSTAIGSPCITTFTTTGATTVAVRAACSSSVLNYQWQYPASLQRGTASVTAISGWTE